MNKVNRFTRARRIKKPLGKIIICPICNSENKVYHFTWFAITCQTCKKIVDKLDFYVKPNQ